MLSPTFALLFHRRSLVSLCVLPWLHNCISMCVAMASELYFRVCCHGFTTVFSCVLPWLHNCISMCVAMASQLYFRVCCHGFTTVFPCVLPWLQDCISLCVAMASGLYFHVCCRPGIHGVWCGRQESCVRPIHRPCHAWWRHTVWVVRQCPVVRYYVAPAVDDRECKFSLVRGSNFLSLLSVWAVYGCANLFLAHLSTKCSGWAIVTGLCPSSVVVRRASCVNFFT